MIKLEASKMTKAIERAKEVKPRVRVINADARTYAVTGRKGDVYTVKFAVANGHKLAECDCKAGQSNMLCFHVAAAAQVNVMVQSMRRPTTPALPVLPAKDADASPAQQTPAAVAARIIRQLECDYTGARYPVTYCDGWAV